MQAVLVINADDLGYTEGHNQAIRDAIEYGSVTSASLLANGVAFEEAVSIAQRHPHIGIGVHLTLIEGLPVSTDASELLTPQKQLPLSNQPYTLAMLKGKLPYQAIRREFEAQIRKVLESGLQPTHLDGHRYIHLLPGITEIVIELAQQFDIPVIRSLHHPADLKLSNPRRLISALIVTTLAHRAFRLYRRAGLHTVTRSLGFMDTGHMNSATLRRLLRMARPGVTELYCHPAIRTARVDQMISEGYQRIHSFDFNAEAAALRDPLLQAYLINAGWTLRHFGNAFDNG